MTSIIVLADDARLADVNEMVTENKHLIKNVIFKGGLIKNDEY